MPTNFRKKLIVAADDFGISAKANRNILALTESGKIDRVAMLINGEFSQEELQQLKDSSVKLDLHLNLPDYAKKQSGKTTEGVTSRGFIFLTKYLFFEKSSVPIVKMEWQRQIEKFREIFGKNPDGLNSHQHIHLFPAYFQAVLELAEGFDISYLRFGKEKLISGKSAVYTILLLNRLWQKIWQKDSFLFDSHKTNSSDYLISLDWINNLEKFLKELPRGKTEIVCHPEKDDEFELMKKYF